MKRGFTLIELLVVIAIIAILAAILFPVFARAREKARQSSCLSNVKQISLGILMYAQDYDESFPFLYTIHDGMGARDINHHVQPYISNWQIFNCPSSNVKVPPPPFSHASRSYGYHVGIFTSVSAPKMLADIERPAQIVMMGDVCQDGHLTGRFRMPVHDGAPDPFECDPDGSNCTECGDSHNAVFWNGHDDRYDPVVGFNFIERHNGTGNVAFCDGHAKAMKHMELYQNGSTAPYFNYTQ